MSAAVLVQAALGSSPPAATLSAIANDLCGFIGFGTGTSPTTGAMVKLTLPSFSGDDSTIFGGSAQNLGGPSIAITPENAVTAALGPFYITSRDSAGNLVINCTVAPAASQAANTYLLSYIAASGPG